MTVALVLVVVVLLVVAVLVGLVVGRFLGGPVASGPPPGQQEALEAALAQVVEQVRQERSASMQAALDTVLSVASNTLGGELAHGREALSHERAAMVGHVQESHSQVAHELTRVMALVEDLRREQAQAGGQMEQHLRVTSSLARTTRSLEQALASPKARGQWGERMADDVLRAAGFVAGINYTRQTRLSSGRVPDYTFPLPTGHVVHMDVKFPIDNYVRWLEADGEPARASHLKAFQRDVRQRIKELAVREYVSAETTVDYLLLFVPNESVYGFLHEHDPALIDEAIAQKVVLCSPTTLFAVLAVIRQAVENFLVERRSDEILGALGGLREEWERWRDPIDKMGRGLQSAQRAFDELSGARYRRFGKQLEKLEAVRDSRRAELDEPEESEVPAYDGSAGGAGVVDPPPTLRQVI